MSLENPDKEVQLGEVGKVDFDFEKGIAIVSINAKIPGGIGIEGGAFIKCDSEQLLNAIFAAIEKKLPDTVDPIAEGLKAILVNAVKSIP